MSCLQESKIGQCLFALPQLQVRTGAIEEDIIPDLRRFVGSGICKGREGGLMLSLEVLLDPLLQCIQSPPRPLGIGADDGFEAGWQLCRAEGSPVSRETRCQHEERACGQKYEQYPMKDGDATAWTSVGGGWQKTGHFDYLAFGTRSRIVAPQLFGIVFREDSDYFVIKVVILARNLGRDALFISFAALVDVALEADINVPVFTAFDEALLVVKLNLRDEQTSEAARVGMLLFLFSGNLRLGR